MQHFAMMTGAFDLKRAAAQTLTYDLTSESGYRSLLVYLMDLLDWADFQIIEQAASFSEVESTNIIGLRGPYGRGGMLLSTSIRPQRAASASTWTSTEDDPHNSTYRDGALYGHGATSGLVDLLTKVHAASRFDRDELTRPLVLAGLFGTNAHIGGVMHLLDSGVCAPEFALIGAGTNLELAQTQPGELDLRIEIVETKPNPPSGKYAFDVVYSGPIETSHTAQAQRIYLVLDAIQGWRQRHIFSVHGLVAEPDNTVHFTIVTDEPDIPYHPLLHIRPGRPASSPAIDTALSAFSSLYPSLRQLVRWHRPRWSQVGATPSDITAIRPINGGIEFALAHWPLPGEDTEALIQDIRAEVQRLLPSHLISRVDAARNVLPFEAPQKSRLLSTCKSALRRQSVPPVQAHYPLSTEAWLLPAYRIDTVVFGPGRQSDHSGRGNEHVPLIHIERAADLYEYVIRRLCCR